MARRKGLLATMAQAQREAEKRRIADQKAQTKVARDWSGPGKHMSGPPKPTRKSGSASIVSRVRPKWR